MKYKRNEFEVEKLKEWLNIILLNETIDYDYVKSNKENEGKWMPLVPTYDYLKMENDEEINEEFYSLQAGKYFNEHGIGFDQHGNELNKEISSDNKENRISNHNKLSLHDEL